MTRTVVLLLAFVAGCGTSDPCANDPASCQDAGQGTCTGQCAPLVANTFRVMVWSGPEGATPPACPAVASTYHGTGYLDAPPSMFTCSPCTCSPSDNTCYPSATMNANAAACPATDAGVQAFNAPAVWDGTCSAMDPVSSADSLTVDPPSLYEQGACFPSGSQAVEFSGGKTIALRCSGLNFGIENNDVPGACPSAFDACTFPNVPGFSVCLEIQGDLADMPCPAGWPTRHLIFEQAEQCYCSCGEPTGELCSTTVTAYADSACMTPLGSVAVTSDQPAACFDVAPSSALKSKSAVLSYQTGTCTPTQTKLQPNTLCCLP